MSDLNPSIRTRVSRPVARWRWQAGKRMGSIRAWFSPTDTDVTERNAHFLISEVFWAAFLSATVAFNAPYALRLGATNAEIGFMSSIPALLALLITIPAGQILARVPQRKPFIVWSLLLYRIGFLLVVLLPWVIPADHRGTVLVWLLIAFTAPAQVFGVAWNAMLADVLPEHKRTHVFATRNIVAAIVATAGIFLAGRWLEFGPYPLSYQTLYGIGFAASMVSLYFIMKVDVPVVEVIKSVRDAGGAAPRPAGPRALWRTARESMTAAPDFVRIVVNTFAYGVGLWMVGPLYVLYFVRTLGANEGWIGINGTLGNLTPILGYMLWQRLIYRWGEKRVLKLSMSVIGLYPLLVGLTPHLGVILAWTALNGLIAPGVNLSQFNMLLKVCPADRRPAYLGIYTSIMNVGAFVMPFVGVALANRFGFTPVLIGGGIVCLIGCTSFRFHGLQTPDSLAAHLSELRPTV
jgi:MFS family permease